MARQERAIRTRRALLVAAAEVFDEVGYEAATISDVLKKSGMTKGALYFHFTSKEELAQWSSRRRSSPCRACPNRS